MKNLANPTDAKIAGKVSEMIIVVSAVMAVAAVAGLSSDVRGATLWTLAFGSLSALLCILGMLSVKYRKRLGLNARPNFVLCPTPHILNT